MTRFFSVAIVEALETSFTNLSIHHGCGKESLVLLECFEQLKKTALHQSCFEELKENIFLPKTNQLYHNNHIVIISQ